MYDEGAFEGLNVSAKFGSRLAPVLKSRRIRQRPYTLSSETALWRD